MFEAAAEEYEREGVPVEPVDFSDNKVRAITSQSRGHRAPITAPSVTPTLQAVVELIGGTPSSLMTMLTEECVFPKGSDATYLQKVNKAFKESNEAFVEVKTSSKKAGVGVYLGDLLRQARKGVPTVAAAPLSRQQAGAAVARGVAVAWAEPVV